jgi:hypothetical protein
MTKALCLNCGDLKFGAICDCPNCKVASSGDMSLDIAFSDHSYSEETLSELGNVIKAIRGASPDDPQERYWAFLQYVSTYHPSILSIRLEDDMAARVARILDAISIPPITLKDSWRNRPTTTDENA